MKLRSPLQADVAAAEVLRRIPGLPAGATPSLDMLKRSTLLQARLIADLPDMARITTAQLQVDPAKVLRADLEHWRGLAATRGIHLGKRRPRPRQLLPGRAAAGRRPACSCARHKPPARSPGGLSVLYVEDAATVAAAMVESLQRAEAAASR